MTKKRFSVRLLIAALIFVVAATFTIRTFFTRAVRVPTAAMANTIVPGDHLFVHRLFGKPSRGDIVTFQYPNDSSYTFVARIIGLPGEEIQLRGKAVNINGRALDEQRVLVETMDDSYGPLKEISSEGSGPYRVFYTKDSVEDTEAEVPDGDFGTATPFRIPDDNYFMLGDNRDNSEDSRYRGPVPRELIWGKASIIYYSVKEPSQDEVRWDRMFTRVK